MIQLSRLVLLVTALLACRPPSLAAVAQDLDAKCTRGSYDACTVLGLRYVTGVQVPRADRDAATRYLRKGCAAGDAAACYNAGVLLRDTAVGEARTLLGLACKAGYGVACHRAPVLTEPKWNMSCLEWWAFRLKQLGKPDVRMSHGRDRRRLEDTQVKRIAGENPHYSWRAKAAGIQGEVLVCFYLDATGQVRFPAVATDLPILGEIAHETISKWKFTPFMKDGKPTGIAIEQPLNFVLEN